MRQLAECGYCGRALCDAFEVDHINERRYDDREENLAATCALCHAIKSRHVRLQRDWSDMRSSLAGNIERARDRWRDGSGWGDLPQWLRERLDCYDAHIYERSLHAPPTLLDLEQFRYRPAKRARPSTG